MRTSPIFIVLLQLFACTDDKESTEQDATSLSTSTYTSMEETDTVTSTAETDTAVIEQIVGASQST